MLSCKERSGLRRFRPLGESGEKARKRVYGEQAVLHTNPLAIFSIFLSIVTLSSRRNGHFYRSLSRFGYNWGLIGSWFRILGYSGICNGLARFTGLAGFTSFTSLTSFRFRQFRLAALKLPGCFSPPVPRHAEPDR